jgi:hypothetical protein
LFMPLACNFQAYDLCANISWLSIKKKKSWVRNGDYRNASYNPSTWESKAGELQVQD